MLANKPLSSTDGYKLTQTRSKRVERRRGKTGKILEKYRKIWEKFGKREKMREFSARKWETKAEVQKYKMLMLISFTMSMKCILHFGKFLKCWKNRYCTLEISGRRWRMKRMEFNEYKVTRITIKQKSESYVFIHAYMPKWTEKSQWIRNWNIYI